MKKLDLFLLNFLNQTESNSLHDTQELEVVQHLRFFLILFQQKAIVNPKHIIVNTIQMARIAITNFEGQMPI